MTKKRNRLQLVEAGGVYVSLSKLKQIMNYYTVDWIKIVSIEIFWFTQRVNWKLIKFEYQFLSAFS